jgi:hypothetical protein
VRRRDTDADGHANGDTHFNTYCHTYCDSDRNPDGNAYTDAVRTDLIWSFERVWYRRR